MTPEEIDQAEALVRICLEFHDPRNWGRDSLAALVAEAREASRIRAELERFKPRCPCCREALAPLTPSLCSECFPGMVHRDGTPCPAPEEEDA